MTIYFILKVSKLDQVPVDVYSQRVDFMQIAHPQDHRWPN